MVKVMLTYLLLFLTCSAFSQTFKVEKLDQPLRGNVFSPAFYGSSLVVCSDQKDRVYKTVKDNNNQEPVDLYVINPSNLDSSERFSKHFRTIYHDGPISFGNNNKEVAISQNLQNDQELKALLKDENKLGIFFCSKKGEGYTKLESFIFNNPSYNITHPSFNESGDTLYFASDMPGGSGGFDLYYTTTSFRVWKTPVNLGPTINTPFDEVFPSIDNNHLYFSSNRGEIGGLDLYATTSVFETEATILDTSINSVYDDFGIISKNHLETGYFSSNRNGQDEIFKLEYEYPTFGPCDSLVKTYFCYTLQDEYALDIENLEGLVYVWNVNGERLYGVQVDYCFPETGEYEITLDIEDTIVNQVFYEQSYIYLSIQYEEQPYITSPDSVAVNSLFTLSAEETYLPNVTIDDADYYWLIDGEIKKRGKSIQHQFHEEGNYEVQLGIIGFDGEMKIQDCTFKNIVCGSPENSLLATTEVMDFNSDSSENVDVIKKDFLYSDPNDSLSFYTIEIASGTTEITSSDFRLKLLEGKYDYKLKYLEEEDLFIYYVGEFESIEQAHEFWKILRQLGLQDAIVRSIMEEQGEINLDDMFVLNNIKFDSDKWDIRPDAMNDLNKVIEIMNNVPEAKLEIKAYTDNTHSNEYNLNLSMKRAESIRDYLVKNGIDKIRLTQYGLGETDPIASNETEQGKELNRRVEFTLKSIER